MKNRIFALLTAILLTMQLVSCGKSALSESIGYDDYTYSEDSNLKGSYESPSFSKEEIDTTSSTDNDLEERKIIKNANVNFETKEYDLFIDSLYKCISNHGAYVEAQSSRGSGVYDYSSMRYADFTIRVPADNYDSFINAVGDIGSVTHINEYQDDVTMNYIDIESRVGALEAEYEALINILEKSTNINDIITVQSRISEINYQLDSLKSQLRKYDDLISYCTVKISVSEVRRETPKTAEMTFGERITSGLSETFSDIADGFTEFSIWFIVTLPYLLIWGVIATAFTIILVKTTKKNNKKSKKNKDTDKITDNNENEKKD